MVERILQEKLRYYMEKYPIVTLTGARQCGKSTLLRSTFPDYTYLSLEDPDLRTAAEQDPRGFLKTYPDKTIIDEAQHVPALFSYLQTHTDLANKNGMYILSGSQNFLLMQNITQSLAGRTAILKLFPFSYRELAAVNMASENINELLFTGGYPRIYDKQIEPKEFYPHYIQTYLEKDVRMLKHVTNLSSFLRFLKLCAGRAGQLLNVSSLANECDITVNTAQSWLSVLEASYIVYLLKPYHKSYNKRIIKSPKIYFYDTGLLCSLLGMTQKEQLDAHFMRGEIFENWVINEYLKSEYNQARVPEVYFWRDSNGLEVDLLIERDMKLTGVEIKSGATMKLDYFKSLHTWQKLAGEAVIDIQVVFGGDSNFLTEKGALISWRNWAKE